MEDNSDTDISGICGGAAIWQNIKWLGFSQIVDISLHIKNTLQCAQNPGYHFNPEKRLTDYWYEENVGIQFRFDDSKSQNENLVEGNTKIRTSWRNTCGNAVTVTGDCITDAVELTAAALSKAWTYSLARNNHKVAIYSMMVLWGL